jgi:hypothetical protein
MIRIAACDGMIFQFSEPARKRNMLGARDLLVAQEHHAVFHQRRTDFRKQAVIVDRIGEMHARQFGADRTRQGFDSHGLFLR